MNCNCSFLYIGHNRKIPSTVENPVLIVTTPYNYTALEQIYKKAKEKGIPIIDDNEDTLQYIRDVIIWATMAQNFYKMGYTARKENEYTRRFLHNWK